MLINVIPFHEQQRIPSPGRWIGEGVRRSVPPPGTTRPFSRSPAEGFDVNPATVNRAEPFHFHPAGHIPGMLHSRKPFAGSPPLLPRRPLPSGNARMRGIPPLLAVFRVKTRVALTSVVLRRGGATFNADQAGSSRRLLWIGLQEQSARFLPTASRRRWTTSR